MGVEEVLEKLTTKFFSMLVFATVILGALMVGCGTGNEAGDMSSGTGGPIEREYTELPFKNVDLEDAPKAIQKWVEENKTTQQKRVFNVDGKAYVIITLGQKPTGGYDVEITQISDVEYINHEGENIGEGTISVSHEVTEPEEGNMVTQAITYPLTIVELDGETDKSFQFTTSLKRKELEELMGNDPDQSVSYDVNSNTQTASGGAIVELVPPQELTGDGKVEGGVLPGFEG